MCCKWLRGLKKFFTWGVAGPTLCVGSDPASTATVVRSMAAELIDKDPRYASFLRP